MIGQINAKNPIILQLQVTPIHGRGGLAERVVDDQCGVAVVGGVLGMRVIVGGETRRVGMRDGVDG